MAKPDLQKIVNLKPLVSVYNGKDGLQEYIDKMRRVCACLNDREGLHLMQFTLENEIAKQFKKQQFQKVDDALEWLASLDRKVEHHCSALRKLLAFRHHEHKNFVDFFDKFEELCSKEYSKDESCEAVLCHLAWLNLDKNVAGSVDNGQKPRTFREFRNLLIKVETNRQLQRPSDDGINQNEIVELNPSPQSPAPWFKVLPPPANHLTEQCITPPAYQTRSNKQPNTYSSSRLANRESPYKRACYKCGATGHLMKDCRITKN